MERRSHRGPKVNESRARSRERLRISRSPKSQYDPEIRKRLGRRRKVRCKRALLACSPVPLHCRDQCPSARNALVPTANRLREDIRTAQMPSPTLLPLLLRQRIYRQRPPRSSVSVPAVSELVSVLRMDSFQMALGGELLLRLRATSRVSFCVAVCCETKDVANSFLRRCRLER